jgi:uncharacterized membrane protein YgdD (TMEM256/DUF423 family)
MSKIFLITGSIAAGLAVVLGAFGAHALKTKLQPDQLLVFETGVRYQMYHAFALIFLFLAGEKLNTSFIQYSGLFFLAGIVLFSGSLYLLACKDLLGLDNFRKIIGPITPLGGLCFVLGWGFLVIAAFKNNIK